MKRIAYECLKLIRRPVVLILWAVFTLADVGVLIQSADRYAPFASAPEAEVVYNDYADRVEGPMTAEKIGLVIEKYEEVSAKLQTDFSAEFDPDHTYTGYRQGDFNVFSELYEGMRRNYYYADDMKEALDKARTALAYYQSAGNGEQVQHYETLLSVYEGRKVPGFYRTDGFEAYFAHTFSALLTLLLLLFVLAGLIPTERESGMDSLILTAKKGERNMSGDKLAACAVVAVMLVTWFTAVDLVTLAVTNGLHGWSNPLYSLATYAASPVGWSIGAQVAFLFLLKVLGAVAVAALIALCSRLAPGTVSAFAAGGILLAGLIVADDLCRVNVVDSWYVLLNPVSAFTFSGRLTAFETVTVGSLCLQRWIVHAVLISLAALLACGAALIALKRRRAA